MPTIIEATLDGIKFEIKKLNIGQLEEVSDVLKQSAPGKVGLGILRIALQRATPKANFDDLSPTVDEVAKLVGDVLTASGLQKPDANPPKAPETPGQ